VSAHELSANARAALAFIADFVDVHGFPPTLTEIAHGCGLAQRSSVIPYVRELEASGQLVVTRRRFSYVKMEIRPGGG